MTRPKNHGKGDCPFCGKDHPGPGVMNREELARHRETENRHCRDYEECLFAAAVTDAVMVPCIACPKGVN